MFIDLIVGDHTVTVNVNAIESFEPTTERAVATRIYMISGRQLIVDNSYTAVVGAVARTEIR